MSTRFVLPALLLVNAGLAAGLASMWFDSSGQVRNLSWQAPAAIKPELAATPAGQADPQAMDLARFAAILERPLFSPSRRPPPPPGLAPPPPPPDPLADIQLFGVYGNADSGGMLARIEGKMRRIALNESFGGWTLKAVQDREVTVSRGDETRTLKLALSKGPRPPMPAATAGQGPAGAPRPASATVEERQQRQQEEERERLRRRNALRASAGLPPLSE